MPEIEGDLQDQHLQELRGIAQHERLEHEAKPPRHRNWWRRLWRKRRR